LNQSVNKVGLHFPEQHLSDIASGSGGTYSRPLGSNKAAARELSHLAPTATSAIHC